MSLDVYLTQPGEKVRGSGIFIREDGQTRQLSRQEWDERFPGCEPVMAGPGPAPDVSLPEEVYSRNITHNLNKMASDAGIYDMLWRPDEHGISKAGQMIEPLAAGLAKLEADPEHFKKFNPANGWGTYGGLVAFVREYLQACRDYPDADVHVSR